jgi:hypothetical protein
VRALCASNLTLDSQLGLDVRICAMRTGKSLYISSVDTRRLQDLVQDRNAPQKQALMVVSWFGVRESDR